MVCSGTASWHALLMATHWYKFKTMGEGAAGIDFICCINSNSVIRVCNINIDICSMDVCEYKDELHCQQFTCSQAMSTGTIYP